MHRFKLLVLFLPFLLTVSAQAADFCKGRMLNPVTDICWGCFFPMNIGGVELPGSDRDNGDAPPPAVCVCQTPIGVPRVGVGISIWEPANIVEVVREPMCSPTLGGVQLGTLPVPAGTNSRRDLKNGSAFYHVHHYRYPAILLLDLFKDFLCLQAGSYDVGWMSEFDLLWDDDQLSMIMNPEAILFANPVAQLACIADSTKAAFTNFGINSLFWCAGSQGSLYPLSGTVAGHTSGIDSSLTLIHRHLFRQHRIGMALDTAIMNPMCQSVPTPMMRKTLYKQQLVYPIPQSFLSFGLGVPSAIWNPGREFPVAGEDYGYLLWRKRLCCVL